MGGSDGVLECQVLRAFVAGGLRDLVVTDGGLILRVRCEFVAREHLNEEEILGECFFVTLRAVVGVPEFQLRTAACICGCAGVVNYALEGGCEDINIDIFTGILNRGGFH